MPRSREQQLQDYADSLTLWAKGCTIRLWRRVDPSNIRPSFAGIATPLLTVHEQLTVRALDAVDLYMMATAADGGWLYATTWQQDRPRRPEVTYRGEPATTAVNRAPLVVLRRIGQGVPVEDAMMFGLNYLLRIYGTEAHEIVRNVTLDRLG